MDISIVLATAIRYSR